MPLAFLCPWWSHLIFLVYSLSTVTRELWIKSVIFKLIKTKVSFSKFKISCIRPIDENRTFWLTTKGFLFDIHPLQRPLEGLCESECTNYLNNKSLNSISVRTFSILIRVYYLEGLYSADRLCYQCASFSQSMFFQVTLISNYAYWSMPVPYWLLHICTVTLVSSWCHNLWM